MSLRSIAFSLASQLPAGREDAMGVLRLLNDIVIEFWDSQPSQRLGVVVPLSPPSASSASAASISAITSDAVPT